MANNSAGSDRNDEGRERRQHEREAADERDRSAEAEPVHDETGERLGNLDEALEDHDYPTTTEELLAAYGDREVETQSGATSLTEILGSLDGETYSSPDDVRTRIQGLIRRG